MLFEDQEFETWAMRGLAWATAGGADFGECTETATRIGNGDTSAWHGEWTSTADRVYAIGEASAAAGHRASASAAFLRASNYYRTATPWLFEAHPSDTLRETVARSYDGFERALQLLDRPGERVEIPFEDGTLPAWLIRSSDETAPLVISNNGYDSLASESYLAHAVPALQHGYHCLIVDGPGQGLALFERGMHLRPDWEAVISAVVDRAITLDRVDASRLALWGWSLGGYLAPRAASGEHRLAALIADPGQHSVLGGITGLLRKLGFDDEEIAHLGELGDDRLQPVIDVAVRDPHTAWSLEQRGLMVHGSASLPDLLRDLARYTNAGRAQLIACPALIGSAEGDALSVTTRQLFDELTCPKRSIHYTAAEGASGHCEMTARTLVNQRTFDWLDEVLA